MEAMGLAITFVAIALTGTAFMLVFLFALLRDSGPSASYWIVAQPQESEKKFPKACDEGNSDDERCTPESKPRNYYAVLTENDSHAKECPSGLIALDVGPAFGGVGWRASPAKHANAFHQRRL